MIAAMWCEPFRRRHFLLADWHSLKTMVSAVMRERQPLVLVVLRRTVAKVLSMGRVASITGQARSTLTRENGQPTDSNLAQPSSVILLRARTPICASVF